MQKKKWYHHHQKLFLALVGVGIGLGVIAAVSYFYVQKTDQEREFTQDVAMRTEQFKGQLAANEEVLNGIVAFFAASNFVTRQEFEIFVLDSLQRHPYIKGLAWVPYVRNADVATFLNYAKKDGLTGFKLPNLNISDTNGEGFYPVFYIEPFEANRNAFGLNLLQQNPTSRKSLFLARDTGKPFATRKIRLVQAPQSSGGVYIFSPMYLNSRAPESLEARRKTLTGFAMGIYLLEDMISSMLKPFEDSGIDLEVFEHSIQEENRLFGFIHNAPLFQKIDSLEFSGQKWILRWSAIPGFLPTLTILNASLVGLVLFLVILCVAIFFRNQAQRSFELANRAEELEELRSAAVKANNAKSDFLANMSHEIRTPLNAVIGFSSLLEETIQDASSLNYVLAIKESGKTLLELINDVLDFSKLEAGKVEVDLTPFNFKAELHKKMKVYSLSAARKDIHITMDLDPNVPDYINSDSKKIFQVLTNLVGNAIKFTPTFGTIKIKIESKVLEGRCLIQVSVIDTGIGIRPGNVKKLFERFKQEDARMARKYGGTGLGLSICKSLVGVLGGEIGAESEYGKGSTFYFSFYAAPCLPVNEPQKTKTEADKHITSQAIKILVVEDNVWNQKLMMSLLNNFGLETHYALNGKEALEKWKMRQDFDLILMDMQMPIMDGLESTRRIRCLDHGDGVIIACLSANVSKENRKEARDAGMDYFLPKPISKKILGDFLQYDFSSRAAFLESVRPKNLHTKPTPTLERHKATSKLGGGDPRDSLVPPINLIELKDFLNELDKDVALEMIDALMEQLALDKEALHLHLLGSKTEEIGFLSHRLKGSLLTFRATEMVELMKEFERKSKNKEPFNGMDADRLNAISSRFVRALGEFRDFYRG